MPPSQDELVERFLNGDDDAVRQIGKWITAAVASYRASLKSDLQDLEQDIMLELLVALRERRFRGQSQLRTYVGGFARYRGIDRIRSRANKVTVDIANVDLESDARTPYDAASSEQHAQRSLKALAGMSASCKELWGMLADGKSYAEMSEALGIAEGTVRVRVSRCRQQAAKERDRLLNQN